jgi:hypothetical protein
METTLSDIPADERDWKPSQQVFWRIWDILMDSDYRRERRRQPLQELAAVVVEEFRTLSSTQIAKEREGVQSIISMLRDDPKLARTAELELYLATGFVAGVIAFEDGISHEITDKLYDEMIEKRGAAMNTAMAARKLKLGGGL